MDLRKVIKFGKATYSMTLPKEWVVEQKLSKGDVVRVEQLPAGNLEVYPGSNEKKVELKEITIEAENKNPEDIFREVVAAYIRNYTVINIKGDVKGKIKELRQRMQELIGLEIMEVGSKKIIAKSFMDVSETKIDQTIKRMFYNIKSMSEEFRQCVDKSTGPEEIKEMDREVNRNTFFTIKYLFKALESPGVASKMGMDNFGIIFTWELVKLLESIADKIKLMADIASTKEILIKENAREEFMEIYDKIEKNFYFAMEEYFKKSKSNVHDIFHNTEEYEKEANEFLNTYKKAFTPLMVDHLKDINMFTKGIAEIIVDFD